MSAGRRRARTVPTELAALAMGVSEATIRKWASRGKITRYGTPQRAEYDLDELFELADGGNREIPADNPSEDRVSEGDEIGGASDTHIEDGLRGEVDCGACR